MAIIGTQKTNYEFSVLMIFYIFSDFIFCQEAESIIIPPAQLFVFCVQSSAEFLHAAAVLMITKTTQAGPPTRNKEI